MVKIDLLRSQKNQVYAAIKEEGLEPSDFHWDEIKNFRRLIHQPTNYFFVFATNADANDTRWAISYFPSQSIAEEAWGGYHRQWEEVLKCFKTWIKILGREHAEPDYWEVSQQQKKLIAEQINDLENSAFSAAELMRISSAINEIKEHLVTSGEHSESQIKFIATRLKHLEDASHRMGRKDWITLTMGTLTNIIVGAALAPDAARELLRIAGTLLGWVVGNIHLLP